MAPPRICKPQLTNLIIVSILLTQNKVKENAWTYGPILSTVSEAICKLGKVHMELVQYLQNSCHNKKHEFVLVSQYPAA